MPSATLWQPVDRTPPIRLWGPGTRVFFSGAPEQLDRAKAVCTGCPARQECFEYAVTDDSLVGVGVGFTEKERREIRLRVA